MKTFALSEIQAQAILDLRLQRLTNMELVTIRREYAEVVRAHRGSEKHTRKRKKAARFDQERAAGEPRTARRLPQDDVRRDGPMWPIDETEDLAFVEDVTVCVCEGHEDPAHADQDFPPLPPYRRISRSSRLKTKSNQRVPALHRSGRGSLHSRRTRFPRRAQPYAQPTSPLCCRFEKNEKIIALFPDEEEGDYLFYLRDGNVKRTSAAEYRLRVKRTAAVSLRDKDRVLGIERYEPRSLLMVTKLGMSIRFAADTVPAMGRVSGGVKCVKLDKGDEVIYASLVPDEAEVLTITDKGFGKRSPMFDYDLQGRNGKGLKTFDLKKNGANGTCIAAIAMLTEPRTITLLQRHGSKTPIHTSEVRIEPRAGKGNMLVAVVLDDDVVGIE